jgi:hypothetical protein
MLDSESRPFYYDSVIQKVVIRQSRCPWQPCAARRTSLADIVRGRLQLRIFFFFLFFWAPVFELAWWSGWDHVDVDSRERFGNPMISALKKILV